MEPYQVAVAVYAAGTAVVAALLIRSLAARAGLERFWRPPPSLEHLLGERRRRSTREHARLWLGVIAGALLAAPVLIPIVPAVVFAGVYAGSGSSASCWAAIAAALVAGVGPCAAALVLIQSPRKPSRRRGGRTPFRFAAAIALMVAWPWLLLLYVAADNEDGPELD